MTVTARSLNLLTGREPLAFDDRARRVMELRRQVHEGTYLADHSEIARAVLEEWIAVGEVVLREHVLPTVETIAARREAGGRFVVERTSGRPAADAATLSA